MNVLAAATVKHLERIVIVIGLMGCAGMPRQSVLAAAALDPNLRLTIAIQTQNIVLGWFGSNAVSYQVEADATLATWTNASLVVTGAGAFLWVTNSLPTRSLGFYRVRRLPPADLISASFDPGTGILTILGDAQDNTITVSRNAAGALLVNNGAVAITGGGPTVANTVLLQIFGREGNDQLSLNEANGALPAAHLFGEAGDDTLAGGASADVLSGGSGSDTLHGWGGADQLSGGDDDDTLTGGDGDDTAQLGLGNDRYIWNPGDDTDVIEGSEGTDTVEVNGGNGAESFTVTANGTRVRFDRLDPAPFALDLGTCENLVLNANGGNDRFSATGNLAALIQITVDGGEGNDTLLGSNGGDVLIGGAGNDFVDGQQGNDVALLGAEDDTFQWDPGDGNDTVEGQTGSDTLVFNGSGANEIIGLSANGTRLRLVRNVGNIVLDLAGVEAVQHRALGGTDTITVNELSGTAVNTVTLDLSGTLGSGVGDSAVDNLILHGSAADDNVAIVQTAGQLEVSGLRPSVLILAADAADTLALNTLGGDDIVDITGVGELTRFTVDAGPGNDVLRGSSRGDVLIGGDDQDTIIGRQGDDLVFGGAGDDVFVWNPGDGNDVLEGQAGNNTLTFNGSNAGETVDIAANGARLNFFRNVGNVVLDGDAVQHIQFNALGGADTVTVGDLSGTDATNVTVDLSASAGAGAGDAQPDRVMVNGSASNDTVTVRGSPGNINVLGLPAWVTVFGGEGTNDTLVVNALGGDDVVDASGLDAGGIQSSFTGGLGDDVMIGSPGDDVFAGGDGDDLILAGAGNDTFLWNPGDDNDTVEGQAGSDTLQFNGSNVGEVIDISANGARVRFFRNVASVVMDCNEVEQIQYKALGGADVVTVNDLAGTDVAEVRVDWAGAGGGGDVQADRVIVSGTSGDDVVLVVGSSGSASVLGLSAQVTVSGSEAANDRLTLNVLGGDDVVDASALSDAVLGLTADGGADDDVLIGSDGPDVLLGGAGNDTLLGGLGVDVLDGGPGDNIVIQ